MAAVATCCERGAVVERGAALHGMGVPSRGASFLKEKRRVNLLRNMKFLVNWVAIPFLLGLYDSWLA